MGKIKNTSCPQSLKKEDDHLRMPLTPIVLQENKSQKKKAYKKRGLNTLKLRQCDLSMLSVCGSLLDLLDTVSRGSVNLTPGLPTVGWRICWSRM